MVCNFIPNRLAHHQVNKSLKTFWRKQKGRWKMKNFLLQLAEQKSFTEDQMKEAFQTVLHDEDVTESEIAAFLMGLKSKGETVEEIAGIVRALLDHSVGF